MGPVDAIVCSPPYADSPVVDLPRSKADGNSTGGIGAGYRLGKRPKGASRKADGTPGSDYGTAEGQLGALRAGPCPGGEAGVGDVETLTWGGCYSQGWGRGLLSPGAFAHPAKFAYGLLTRLYDHGFARGWWQKQSLICDPFGGVGCGGVVAAYRGLRWVGCELEPRFVALAEETFALHRGKWAAAGDTPPLILQGDSRNFAAVVACVTSPAWVDPRGRPPQDAQGDSRQFAAPAAPVAGVITSPPYADQPLNDNQRKSMGHQSWKAGDGAMNGPADYGTAPGQLGALKAGDADSVITSPPYAGIDVADVRHLHFDEGRRAKSVAVKQDERFPEGYGTTPGQLGALKAGDAEAVLTSPPYAASVHGRNGIDPAKCDRPGAHTQAGAQGYGEASGNVGNLKAGDADSVVTSPPWEDCTPNHDSAENMAALRAKMNAAGITHGSFGAVAEANGYGTASGQVGALRQETYWSAMKIIWEQAYLALRPGGVLCCVIKDFVRAKKRVPLCDQTWRLLLSLGFTPVERIRCLLSEETREPSLFGGVEVKKRSRQSFFRRLATKKGAPEIPFEEILVVRRPAAGEG